MKSKQIFAASVVLAAILASVVVAVEPSAALKCAILPDDGPDSICGSAGEGDLESSGVWKLLLLGLNILTAGVGVVAVGAIAYAGFLYTTAQSNAEQTKKALEMIRNTAIGLLLFAFMFAIINFLVPGGVFGDAPATSPPVSSPPIAPDPICSPGGGACEK